MNPPGSDSITANEPPTRSKGVDVVSTKDPFRSSWSTSMMIQVQNGTKEFELHTRFHKALNLTVNSPLSNLKLPVTPLSSPLPLNVPGNLTRSGMLLGMLFIVENESHTGYGLVYFCSTLPSSTLYRVVSSQYWQLHCISRIERPP